jgi:hypothetical protein
LRNAKCDSEGRQHRHGSPARPHRAGNGRTQVRAGHRRVQWDVDLDPGAYQLDVFARFEASDGRAGDVSGVLGLTVPGPKENDALGVHGVKRSMQVCPFAG